MLKELNYECFTYGCYESSWWSLLDLDYVESMDMSRIMRAVRTYAVGYCDSARVGFRPKTTAYAVMFEKDDLRFWFHLEKWYFEE